MFMDITTTRYPQSRLSPQRTGPSNEPRQFTDCAGHILNLNLEALGFSNNDEFREDVNGFAKVG